MKYKTQEPEKSGMNKELYNLITDLIQMNLDFITLCNAAQNYFQLNGFYSGRQFFQTINGRMKSKMDDLTDFLRSELEKVPELTIMEEDTDFKDKMEPFDIAKQLELAYYAKLKAIAEKAIEVKDMSALANSLSWIQNYQHACCMALEAVRNGHNPTGVL